MINCWGSGQPQTSSNGVQILPEDYFIHNLEVIWFIYYIFGGHMVNLLYLWRSHGPFIIPLEITSPIYYTFGGHRHLTDDVLILCW
jgi:hypothetical protein